MSPLNVWPKFESATNTSVESLGYYSSGCLAGGQRLPDSKGVRFVAPERKAKFGHLQLIAFLNDLSKTVRPLLVGDMSLPRGGPMAGGHASHQNGLDVDLYYKLDKDGKALSMVDRSGRTLSSEWKTEYAKRLFRVVSDVRVDRVFVNAAIKKALCGQSVRPRGFHKIRPWYFHDSHFHVRLSCPEGSKDCRAQKSLDSSDDGCAQLDWWLSKDVLSVKRPKKPVLRVFQLPESCLKVAQGL